MRQFYRLLLVAAGLFFLPTPAQSCSCIWVDTYCDYVREIPEWDIFPRIIRGTVLRTYSYPLDTLPDGWVWQAPLIDVLVKDVIFGEVIGQDTITLYGQDGLNCAAPISWVGNAPQYLFFVPSLNPDGIYDWFHELPVVTNYPLGELPGCGPGFLEIIDDQINGPIYPGINQMSLAEFEDEVNNCVGFTPTEEVNVLEELRVFPNPTSGLLQVTHRPAEIQKMTLLDLQGRVVQEIRTSGAVTAQQEIDLSDLPAGLYLLTLYSNGERVTKRVMKR